MKLQEMLNRYIYVTKAIAVLTAWKPKTHDDVLNRIVNLGEYEIEKSKLEAALRQAVEEYERRNS